MLDVGVIVPMEESKWIIPMVLKPNNNDDIQICVYLGSLNVAYIHEPFLKPFIDEVLENVGGQESYSFTYKFLGYD